MNRTGRILALDGRAILESALIRLDGNGTGSFQVPLTVAMLHAGSACVLEIGNVRREVTVGMAKMMRHGNWEVPFNQGA